MAAELGFEMEERSVSPCRATVSLGCEGKFGLAEELRRCREERPGLVKRGSGTNGAPLAFTR
jgi:hypothetical protein